LARRLFARRARISARNNGISRRALWKIASLLPVVDPNVALRAVEPEAQLDPELILLDPDLTDARGFATVGSRPGARFGKRDLRVGKSFKGASRQASLALGF
jgi:hypothetical protein